MAYHALKTQCLLKPLLHLNISLVMNQKNIYGNQTIENLLLSAFKLNTDVSRYCWVIFLLSKSITKFIN